MPPARRPRPRRRRRAFGRRDSPGRGDGCAMPLPPVRARSCTYDETAAQKVTQNLRNFSWRRPVLGCMNTILVTVATGNVGRPLVELLAAAGAHVRAVTRDPASARFPAGVEVVESAA